MGRHIVRYKVNQSILPSDYTQLEYIESSGTQYIATGVSASNQSITVSTEMACAYTTNYTKTLGYSVATSDQPFSIWAVNNSYSGYGTPSITTTNITTFHEIYMYNAKITIPELYIFDINPNVSGYVRTTGKIKITTITVDGVVVRNLVPAKDSGGVVGMYDTENDVFYTNSGTGDFIAGPVGGEFVDVRCLIASVNPGVSPTVVPAGYTQLEYIQSDPNYNTVIKTGVYIDQDCTIDSKFTYLSTINGTFLYGARTSYGYNAAGVHQSFAPFGADGNDGAGTGYISVPTGSAIVFKQDKTGIYMFGGIAHTYEGQTFTTPVTCAIFNCCQGRENNYYTSRACHAMCYYFKITKNNTPLFNGVPAMRNSDNAVGMYDTVSETFKVSAVNGEFIAGPVQPSNRIIHSIKTREVNN